LLGTEETILATATVGTASTWMWHLKIDHLGLFRWYMDGNIQTNLRGSTREHADTALRRFVEQSLGGELQITNLAPRFGADSEHARTKSTSTGIA
jgi:hypothetical protein